MAPRKQSATQLFYNLVVPGGAFLRPMIDLTKGATIPYQHTRLSRGVVSLETLKGDHFFLNDVLETSQTLELHTDTAASIGFEAVLVAITFMLLGRTTGKPKTASRCWNFYPLSLLFTFGGHLWKTNVSILLLLRLLHIRLQNPRLSCGVQGTSVELL